MIHNNPLWLVVFATLLALVPILIGIMTSYVKVNIILGFLRSGLGAQQVPGNLVIMALSMSLTAFIMSPVIDETLRIAEGLDKKVFETTPEPGDFVKLTPLFQPWKAFMKEHSGAKELRMLKELEKNESEDLSLRTLMPAFVLTEVKASFMMGFMVLLPFLVIDLVVANILAGMGMYMLSPVIISLPLKLVLFVLSDGWLLLTKGIIQSY